MNFVDAIDFAADLLTVILSLGAIFGVIAAHKHGIFRALREIGRRAK
jgi:hypothetical protein